MTDDIISENIARYAARHQLQIGIRLGMGIHGTIFNAERKGGFISAIKAHLEEEPFIREMDVYARLREYKVRTVC